MFSLPKNVTLIEVGPRDGLQNENNSIPTDQKLAFIHALQNAGVREMEITSFVSPKWVPQMADAAEIVHRVKKLGRQLVLTPNARGAENALESGAESFAVFVGVSDTFNRHNINRSTAESMELLQPIITQAKKEGHFVRACISTAFHCPYEGFISPAQTMALCQQFVRMGVDELSVADTDGMANPSASYSLFLALKEQFPDILITAHFHDTRKLGLANIYASLQAGVDRFDTSAGGLGGCPFAPGATGNVATEDVLYLLDSLEIETGIDREKICAAVDTVAPYLSRPIETAMYNLYKRNH
ncbi:hydroxymethylglutaryl-CoA lyase [Sporosarcina sp. P37]|uniref:hydroxymethylglutaryl-CoA lyase n=1 Tax=unclassified Sporosarcina TaxID=2647733 RepID=UPI000A17C8E2|nr:MULTISPECIES: hydroxymethylglutaryl-CoA lyase [unclassified Sporosarcina]ARK25852.1 hydroxymethylglutaryl-CoA lyase [Sporosarcina sp. P37]PID19124.1 hydroxymethylglutaryl-CoA lyase [Sporosarcina sp. P35]